MEEEATLPAQSAIEILNLRRSRVLQRTWFIVDFFRRRFSLTFIRESNIVGWFALVESVTTRNLYVKFKDATNKRGGEEWVLAVFEGPPSGDAYSWCSDCVAASGDLRSFLSDYKGRVRTVQFKVGTQDEWEGPDGASNPFKRRFPFLSDLPTAILFHGWIDVARIIAPRKKDLLYLSERADIFDEQLKDGSWKPLK